MFDELVKELISRVEGTESKARSRNELTQMHFNHAVRVLVTDLWKSYKSYPVAECRINKRSGHPDYPAIWVSDCGKWRVIRCVDDLQYTVQKYRSPKWRNKSYHKEWKSMERRWGNDFSF